MFDPYEECPDPQKLYKAAHVVSAEISMIVDIPAAMAVRQNLIELCEIIAHGHYKIDENCAEYKVFEQWMTDDQIEVLMALGLSSPKTAELIAEESGLNEEKTDSRHCLLKSIISPEDVLPASGGGDLSLSRPSTNYPVK